MKIEKIIVGPLRTNCYILSSEKNNAILIDPGDEAGKLIRYLEKNKLNLSYILLTHGHFDHILALEELKNKYLKTKVFISEKDVKLMQKADEQLKFIGMESRFPKDKPIDFDVEYLKEGDLIELDDIKIKIIETPGHTKGSLSFLANGTDLFSGDTLFKENVGRTDLPGGDLAELKESLRKLISLDDKINIFPGHGDISTIGNEREWLTNFLR